jgi:hypothetical protein
MTNWSAVLTRAFEKIGKGCGDSGDSGDNSAKTLKIFAHQPKTLVTTPTGSVVTVVTPSAAVTTVTTSSGARGDSGRLAFSETIQLLSPPVTTVTTVTTASEAFGKRALDRLRSMTPPESFGAETWYRLLIDAEAFFQRWDEAAKLLGWTDEDLLGVHPKAPAARFDAMGLMLILRGGEVVELYSRYARIRTQGGSLLVYRKHGYAGSVMPWSLV